MDQYAVDGHDAARRRVTAALVMGALAASLAAPRRSLAQVPRIEVWTGPSCSCCHDWIEHLQAHGFQIEAHDGGNADARARLGIPVRYGSCHTAEIEGFAIEGHVHADEICRLLEERPDAVGLAVPSMPRGSPGMDGPAYGGVRDPYDVLLITRDGSAQVFASHR